MSGFINQGNSNARLAFIILLSTVIHILAYRVIASIDFLPEITQSSAVSTLIVNLLNEESTLIEAEVPDVKEISPPTLNQSASEKLDFSTSKVPDVLPSELTKPVDISRQPSIEESKENALPDANRLIENSLRASRETAREMESLVKLTEVFDKRFREKLEMARRKENLERETRKPDSKREVYRNQMGDVVIASADNCYVIPGIFFFDTFKPLNSIIAMPDPSCNQSKNKVIDLTD